MMSLEKLLFSTYRKLKVPLRRLRSRFQAKSPADLLKEQEQSFRNLGLVRDIDAVISNFPGLKSSASQGLVSEHYPLFASIAASGFSPQTILEIGTFDGAFTRFLSLIFPYAAITTYDLPLEEGFQLEYGRADQEKYVSERSKNIDDVANVTLVERNSVSLTLDSVSRFDAIWVDGDHGYPVATMDITNAIRLLTPGGYLVIDDVFVCRRGRRKAPIVKLLSNPPSGISRRNYQGIQPRQKENFSAPQSTVAAKVHRCGTKELDRWNGNGS